METQPVETQPPLSEGELAQIDLVQYAQYSGLLFLHVIVQRGAFWHSALLLSEGGKVKHSSVNPRKFTREERARKVCQQEHYQMRQLFKLAELDFDIRTMWFE